jgi:hypothetical protein
MVGCFNNVKKFAFNKRASRTKIGVGVITRARTQALATVAFASKL